MSAPPRGRTPLPQPLALPPNPLELIPEHWPGQPELGREHDIAILVDVAGDKLRLDRSSAAVYADGEQLPIVALGWQIRG